jgi:hypothetical protein
MQYRFTLILLAMTLVVACGRQEKQHAVPEAEVAMYHNGDIITMGGCLQKTLLDWVLFV